MGGLRLPDFPNCFSGEADFLNETHAAPASVSEGVPEAPPGHSVPKKHSLKSRNWASRADSLVVAAAQELALMLYPEATNSQASCVRTDSVLSVAVLQPSPLPRLTLAGWCCAFSAQPLTFGPWCWCLVSHCETPSDFGS